MLKNFILYIEEEQTSSHKVKVFCITSGYVLDTDEGITEIIPDVKNEKKNYAIFNHV